MKKRIVGLMMATVMTIGLLTGCGSTSDNGGDNAAAIEESTEEDTEESAEDSESTGVLRVGMECAYAPFNWTQETEEVPNGDKAVPTYGTSYYA